MEVVPTRGKRTRRRRRRSRRRAAFVGCVIAATSMSIAAAAAQPEQPHGDDPGPGLEGWGKQTQHQSSDGEDVGVWAAEGSGASALASTRPSSAGPPDGLEARPTEPVCVVVLGKAYDVATVGELLSAMRVGPDGKGLATPPLRTPLHAGPCTGSEEGNAGHGSEVGVASWYHAEERYTAENQGLTAASLWLPFGTEVSVTNLATGVSVTVVINDRGPFGGRLLDLSEIAFSRIAPVSQGVASVRITW